jgi:hypothetical protein
VDELVVTYPAHNPPKYSKRPKANLPGRTKKVFSKCADSLENGRRLENLSWRLWNRETFCCDDDDEMHTSSPMPMREPTRLQDSATYSDVPELSSSVESAPSEDELPKQQSEPIDAPTRPCLIRSNSSDRYRGREKHMTPVNLARIMEDIDRDKSSAEEWKNQRSCPPSRKASSMPTEPERVAPVMPPLSRSVEECSEARNTHSVVRGFSPGRVCSSYRSSTNVSSPSPTLLKTAPVRVTTLPKKSMPVFFLGSPDENENDSEASYDSYGSNSSCGEFRRSIGDKKTSFHDQIATRVLYDDEAMTSDDDAISESAIEDDDLEWESSSESGHNSYDEGALFRRVESRPELTSRRSLLSTMLHEPERATTLQSAASRSSPALRRTISPRAPPLAMPIHEETEFPGSKPIRRSTYTSSNPLALSPRTTRRNMLATELTESLRKHLLWERQQKNTTAAAHLKRRHTAADVTRLTDYPQRTKGCASKTNSWSKAAVFDQGQNEYHHAGW